MAGGSFRSGGHFWGGVDGVNFRYQGSFEVVGSCELGIAVHRGAAVPRGKISTGGRCPLGAAFRGAAVCLPNFLS